MDVFELRRRLVHDYERYIRSFISIREERIRDEVDRSLIGGMLWPEPRIGLDPSFERGGRIDDLVDDGRLHPECSKNFRIKPEHGPERALTLHRHQVTAIDAARTGGNYVLTTGTGSGKSLAYIIPVVDHVLRSGTRRGVKAIIVYPMNALATTQFGELKRFLKRGYPAGGEPVTFRRYTGQESDEERADRVGVPHPPRRRSHEEDLPQCARARSRRRSRRQPLGHRLPTDVLTCPTTRKCSVPPTSYEPRGRRSRAASGRAAISDGFRCTRPRWPTIFNHRFRDYAMKRDGDGGTALPDVPLAKLQDPTYVVQPRYWVAEPNVRGTMRDPAAGWLLGFRDICRAPTSAR